MLRKVLLCSVSIVCSFLVHAQTAVFDIDDSSAAFFRGDVAPANSSTYTITRSGVYALTCAKTASGVPAISITASNVTLDLGGNTITGGTDGIQVTGNNVTIQNGTISSMSGNGILLQGAGCRVAHCDLVSCTTGITLQSAQTCVLENCRVRNAVQAGISLISTWTSSVIACQVVGVSGATSVYGISAQNGGDNTIKQCLIREISTRSSTGSDKVVGLALVNETVSSAYANDIQAVESLTTVSAYGVWVNTGNTALLANNTVAGVTTSNGRGQGVLINQTQSYVANNLCFDCDRSFTGVSTQFITSQANDRGAYNIDASLTTSDDVVDMHDQQLPSITSQLSVISSQVFTSESKLDLLAHCEPIAVRAAGTLSTAYGTYCLGSDITGLLSISGTGIELCCGGHTINANAGANGLVISGNDVVVTQGTVRNASASGIKITGDNCLLDHMTSFGNVTGFELASADRNLLTNCSALNNTREGFLLASSQYNTLDTCHAVNTSGFGVSVGIRTQDGTSNRFEKCDVNGVASSANQAYGVLGYHEQKSNFSDCSINGVSGQKYNVGLCVGGDSIATPTNADFMYVGSGFVYNLDWLNLPVGTYVALADYQATSVARVLSFSPTGAISLVAQTSPFDNYIRTVKWLSWNNQTYLAIGGYDSAGDDIAVMAFDPSVNTLTKVAGYSYPASASAVVALDWFMPGINPCLVYGAGQAEGTNEIGILGFDGSSLTVLDGVSLPDTIWFVEAHRYQGLWYVAAGSQRSSSTNILYIYKVDDPQNSASLTLVATYTTETAGRTGAIEWLDFDNKTYLALAINNNASAPVVRVLRYDETATTTLTQVATFNYGAAANGVSWLVTGTSVYLGIGGSLDGQETKVLQFDPYAQTLSAIFNYDDTRKTANYDVAWNRVANYNDRVFLAVGLDASSTATSCRVLGFQLGNQSQLCYLGENTIADVANGTGLLADPAANAALNNVAYNCKEGILEDVRTQYFGVPFDATNWSVPNH